MNEIKELILSTIDDLVANFLYYDRKEDDELPMGVIDRAVQNKTITIGDMGDYFKMCIGNGLVIDKNKEGE